MYGSILAKCLPMVLMSLLLMPVQSWMPYHRYSSPLWELNLWPRQKIPIQLIWLSTKQTLKAKYTSLPLSVTVETFFISLANLLALIDWGAGRSGKRRSKNKQHNWCTAIRYCSPIQIIMESLIFIYHYYWPAHFCISLLPVS